MDGLSLTLFLVATFFGGITTGVAGFAMGLVVSGVWLHILTPLQTATLITGYGLLLQGYSTWRFRRSLNWSKGIPLVLGSAAGIPLGVLLLNWVNPGHLKIAIGALLLVYSAYGLARPTFKPVKAGAAADLGIGVANGILGGLTGLGGVIVTIWGQLHNWPKDVQRAVFQPVIFVVQAITAVWLVAGAGGAAGETTLLYVMGLPALFLGMWVGIKLYGKLDEVGFRRIVLVLLLLSGLFLIVRL